MISEYLPPILTNCLIAVDVVLADQLVFLLCCDVFQCSVCEDREQYELLNKVYP